MTITVIARTAAIDLEYLLLMKRERSSEIADTKKLPAVRGDMTPIGDNPKNLRLPKFNESMPRLMLKKYWISDKIAARIMIIETRQVSTLMTG